MITGVDYDPKKTDIWSSGITLYVMLCGDMPFKENTIDLLYRTILKKEVKYPEYLSELAIDFLTGLLKKDPDERFDFQGAFGHPWILENKPSDFDYLVSIKSRKKMIKVTDSI